MQKEILVLDPDPENIFKTTLMNRKVFLLGPPGQQPVVNLCPPLSSSIPVGTGLDL